jgi:hypothetical protein
MTFGFCPDDTPGAKFAVPQRLSNPQTPSSALKGSICPDDFVLLLVNRLPESLPR